MIDPSPAVLLKVLHRGVDARFETSTAAIGEPIACRRGCATCCQDDLTVWGLEAEAIADHVRNSAIQLAVHPAGACALLDDTGACQVHPVRPYVCRSQGAVLTWQEDDGQGGDTERRDTCPVHALKTPLDRLPLAALFQLGPAERTLIALATSDLTKRGLKGLPERVGLRDLAEKLATAS